VACTSKSVQYSLETTFVPFIVKRILRVFKLVVVFVDSVVSEMNEHIVDVGIVEAASFELFRCKPHQSFVVKKYLERVTTSYQHVKSYVKFEIIDKVGFFEIFLDNDAFVCWIIRGLQCILYVVSYEYSFSLREAIWFHDKCQIATCRPLTLVVQHR
jgi:hypothetical protein